MGRGSAPLKGSASSRSPAALAADPATAISRGHPSQNCLHVCMQTCGLGTPATCGSPPHPSQEVVMILLVVAAVLVVLWLLGLVAFHVTAFAIHLLLIAAVIAVIAHFALGKRSGRTRV